MPHRRLLIPVLAVLALVAFATAATASHSWGPYHWARQSNPFTVKLGDNCTSTWDSYLSTASADWTASSVLNTTIVAGGTRARQCKPTDGRVEVCNARYGNNGWLGIAQIWITGGEHITQSIVKLNDTYHDTSPYNQPAWRRNVMCQEIGHAFGLDHQDENFNNGNLGTCMDYTSDPDGPPSNEHPNAHDYDQLETIYAHLDSTTTVKSIVGRAQGGMPPAMGEIDFASPAQWGKLIGLSRDGGQAVFELDFDHGNKVVTFVTWNEEVARDLASWAERGQIFEK
jgi:hypothetical protein